MVKSKFTDEDDALLAALGVEVEAKKVTSYTPREERIIAGFEEIERFFQEHNRLPSHAEDNDIFERLYAVRLDKTRQSDEAKELLKEFDKYGMLKENLDAVPDISSDEELLAALGAGKAMQDDNDITHLKHVRTRAEIKAAEEIAQRKACKDFDLFKSIFDNVQKDLKNNIRQTISFGKDGSIKQDDLFILGGQVAYVAKVGEDVKQNHNGQMDARLRVIFSNRTESDLLRSSLSRALYKDDAGRRITRLDALGLYSQI